MTGVGWGSYKILTYVKGFTGTMMTGICINDNKDPNEGFYVKSHGKLSAVICNIFYTKNWF